jgi:hypothetical protein
MSKLMVVLALIALAGVGALYLAFKVFNSPDGERYRKRRMQGSFVPLSAEEIAEDEARIAADKSKT